LAAPRRGMSGRSSQDQEANQHSKDPSRSHGSSSLLAASQLSPCLKATRPPRDPLTPLAFSARVPWPQSTPSPARSPAWLRCPGSDYPRGAGISQASRPVRIHALRPSARGAPPGTVTGPPVACAPRPLRAERIVSAAVPHRQCG
jgi:hypothetical protein